MFTGRVCRICRRIPTSTVYFFSTTDFLIAYIHPKYFSILMRFSFVLLILLLFRYNISTNCKTKRWYSANINFPDAYSRVHTIRNYEIFLSDIKNIKLTFCYYYCIHSYMLLYRFVYVHRAYLSFWILHVSNIWLYPRFYINKCV